MGVVVLSLPAKPTVLGTLLKKLVSDFILFVCYSRPGRQVGEAGMVTPIWPLHTLRTGEDKGELGG